MSSPSNARVLAEDLRARVLGCEQLSMENLRGFRGVDLKDLADVSRPMLDALLLAVRRLDRGDCGPDAILNAIITTQAVAQFGVGWDPDIWRTHGYDALQYAREVSRATGDAKLAVITLLGLAHHSPRFQNSQIEYVINSESSAGQSQINLFEELSLASPRALLLRGSDLYSVLPEIDKTLSAATMVLTFARDAISDPSLCEDAKFSRYVRLTRESLASIAIVIPAVSRLDADKSSDLREHLLPLVDSLDWLVRARNSVAGVSATLASAGAARRRQTVVGEDIEAIRDLAWLSLAVILDRTMPWALNFQYEREQLIGVASKILEDYHHKGYSRAGHLAVKVFLSLTDPERVADADFCRDVSVSITSQLKRFLPGSPLCPAFNFSRGDWEGGGVTL